MPPGLAGWLWGHARPQRGWFLLGGAALLSTNALALLIPWILKDAVEAVRARALPAALWGYAGALAGVAILAAVARVASRAWIYRAGREVEHSLRVEAVGHVLRLPLSYFRCGRMGDTLSRAINDVGDVRMMVGPGYLQLVNTALVYGGALVPMLALSPRLTVVALAPYPVIGWVFKRLSAGLHGRSAAVQRALGSLSARVQESMAGALVIKCFRTEAVEEAAIAREARAYADRTLELAWLRNVIFPVVAGLAGIGMVLLVGMGGTLVDRGELRVGELVAFLAYYAMLLWPTVGLGWIVNAIGRGRASADRLLAVLAVEPEPVGARAGDPPGPAARGHTLSVGDRIEVRDLAFSYAHGDGARGPALDGVTLSIPAGAIVGITGPTASGKSTLLSLLVRFYDPPPGTVLIDGIDVLSIDLARLRGGIALVPQEGFHFSATLEENILMGLGAGGAGARRAAAMAGLEPDLAGLPGGLATPVGERGVTLSGGQRQRLALARAIVRDPPVLLLDDTLSGVDPATEAAILDELARRRRTTVVVSSRPQVLLAADLVYVLEGGRVVEGGPPASLLSRPGRLARLVAEARRGSNR